MIRRWGRAAPFIWAPPGHEACQGPAPLPGDEGGVAEVRTGVYEQGLAGDVAGGARSEEDGRRGDILRRRCSLERRPGRGVCADAVDRGLREPLAEPGRINEARADGVDADLGRQ